MVRAAALAGWGMMGGCCNKVVRRCMGGLAPAGVRVALKLSCLATRTTQEEVTAAHSNLGGSGSVGALLVAVARLPPLRQG